MSDLIATIVDQLGVTDEQAAGGMGAILSLPVERLDRDDLVTLADAIPGFSDIVGKSPVFDAAVPHWLATLSRWCGGLGAMRQVGPVFSSLGLTYDLIDKFTVILREFLAHQPNEKALRTLEKALN
ncbi:DUF2780 domain-containing protein [Adhaeretor mobilis]|uniref:Uncharacterized protein n=1 Tax=Adhaeretor mobilis TaxID=1930276 RepID=A0A517N0R5_9BACT|nr:DUF2780 domain-containing protein [Adhaeretor mobilis]QDT00704.1 hypothetical protein HG15A2_40440 [Adhaeretor mobilis]